MRVGYDGVYPAIPEGYEEGDFLRHNYRLITRKDFPSGHRVLPSFIVRFRYGDAEHYFSRIIIENWPDYTLSPEVMDWLNANAVDYRVSIYRGDFGEGAPSAAINFATSAEADAFTERFDHEVNVLTFTDKGFEKLRRAL